MEDLIKTGVLISVAENSKPNVNGTMFHNCTVEFNGEQFGAIMYSTVYDKGVAIGSTVNFAVTVIDADNVLLSVLGNGAKRATLATFGIEIPA